MLALLTLRLRRSEAFLKNGARRTSVELSLSLRLSWRKDREGGEGEEEEGEGGEEERREEGGECERKEEEENRRIGEKVKGGRMGKEGGEMYFNSLARRMWKVFLYECLCENESVCVCVQTDPADVLVAFPRREGLGPHDHAVPYKAPGGAWPVPRHHPPLDAGLCVRLLVHLRRNTPTHTHTHTTQSRKRVRRRFYSVLNEKDLFRY